METKKKRKEMEYGRRADDNKGKGKWKGAHLFIYIHVRAQEEKMRNFNLIPLELDASSIGTKGLFHWNDRLVSSVSEKAASSGFENFASHPSPYIFYS